jgi:hypothetical protein
MKLTTASLLTVSILAAVTFFMAASCKKSNSSSSSAQISASISGANFQGTIVENVYSKSGRAFILSALSPTKPDSTVFQMTFFAPAKLNVPFSSDTSFNMVVSYSDLNGTFDWGASYLGSGKAIINITAWDSVNNKVTGTVTGSLYDYLNYTQDSVIVTKGQFNTSYTVVP